MGKDKFKPVLLVAVCVVVVLATGYFLHRPPPAPVAVVVTNAPSPVPPPAPPPVAPTNSVVNNSTADPIQALAEKLKSSSDANERKRLLADWRKELANKPVAEASAEIRHFLDSHQDAPTGLGFKVGKKGVLDQAPTLRTALLDYLGQIDPAAAADYARTILASADSPDEWAVALRNLAQGDTSADGRAFLQTKLAELLQNTAWQKDPSVSYLEAFDAAVYAGGTNQVPALSGLLRAQDNPAVAHASYLAMDRMVINNPAEMLTALEAQPDLMQGREQTRADYFARADVRDPSQRQVLENYLLNPALSPKELQTFAGTFPNANYMISDNLLTTASTPSHDDLTARDAASLATVQQWSADPRFQKLQPQLQTMLSRLNTFVNQAQHK